MKETASACPLDCPDACGVLVQTDDAGRFQRLRGNPDHSYSRGSLCGKTAIYGDILSAENRLRHPLLRRADGTFERASWDAAIERIVERVRGIPGERILSLNYAGCMGLVNRNFPMRVMHGLGATETDGGICDNTANDGYEAVFGYVVGADIEELDTADFLLLWGIDVRRTHQHLSPAIQRLCRRGVTVVLIDIWRTDTMRAIEKWGGRGLVIRQGTDALLALTLARLAFERGVVDEAFLEAECVGADRFREGVLGDERTELHTAAAEVGIEAEEISKLAEELFAAKDPFLKAGVGFTRRRNGGMSMRAVCSLAALFGERLRHHFQSSGHYGVDLAPVNHVEYRKAPRSVIRHVQAGRELESGRFDAVFVWGHNPVLTIPDSNRVKAGLAREETFLVVHELFMTDTAALADVVLPATGFVEQCDVYRSYGHRVLQFGARAAQAPDEQLSNVHTFARIGRALGLPESVWDVTEEGLCDELLETLRERVGDRDLERIKAGEPVKLRDRVLAGRGTPTGKIELYSETLAAAGEPGAATYVRDEGVGGPRAFHLISAPSVATHNSTYLYSSRHAKRAGEPVCYLAPQDARSLGAEQGSRVRLANDYGSLTLPVELSEDVPAGNVRVDGFFEPRKVPEGIGINALTSGAVSDIGEGNVLYSARVDITVP